VDQHEIHVGKAAIDDEIAEQQNDTNRPA
jgi:hypothetical protein